ncbi:MAG: hypothetical protein L0H84_17830 [Pseudonocardia sp.]|nr:hypothetical protein [Pseudonocardia sp.]
MDPLLRPAGVALTRRDVLTRVVPVMAAVPAVAALGGCSLLGKGAARTPDPLPALADAARADAALVTSVITTDPSLLARMEPLRAARLTHAAALDQVLGRPVDTGTPTPPPRAAAASAAGNNATTTGAAGSSLAGVRRLHDAMIASAAAATAAALALPAEQVGLVASISACCSAYAALM